MHNNYVSNLHYLWFLLNSEIQILMLLWFNTHQLHIIQDIYKQKFWVWKRK